MSQETDDDDGRLKNFLICKIYATDAEIDEMGPAIIAILVVCIMALIALVYFRG